MKRGPFAPLGATGAFPRGKLHERDEGEIQIGVTATRGTVVIAFGKEIAWLGLPPQQAREFAAAIVQRADEAAQAQ